MFTKVSFVLILSIVLIGCAVSPTGRKQVILFSEDQVSEMGIAAYVSMKKEQKLSVDKKSTQYVQCIADRLLKNVPESIADLSWEVSVFEDDTPNAFALPGGKIGVHTGMLKITKTPEQLAAVIGHEIGHVWAKHGNERMSQQSLAQSGLQLAAVLAGEQTTEKMIALSALGVATKGVVLKFSRIQESEADQIGLAMMARSGFDPKGAVTLWQEMAKMNQSNVPEFFSTHPSEKSRIKELTRQMEKQFDVYQSTIKTQTFAKCSP